MIPVGVKGSIESQKSSIEGAGLAILAEAKQIKKDKKVVVETTPKDSPNSSPKETAIEDKDVKENTSDDLTKSASDAVINGEPRLKQINQKSTLVKQTIRSGQQISAPDGDLIIIGSVSPGAEILAAGNIHIYGTLRGRALAGIKGDQKACIFCHNLQAELISIAGIYLLSDDIPPSNIAVANHINLTDEKLIFNSL
jgi:septum site-determining protein MinC